MSEQIEIRVTAAGSTDAADQAKAEARRQGYRIQTVAAIRPVTDVAPGPHKRAGWVVTLAVRPRVAE